MSAVPPGPPASDRRRANDLDGTAWTRASISVWSDLRKSPEEVALGHPAMFPTALAERVISCFTRAQREEVVLDPFCGSGSALVAACRLGRRALGYEVCQEYALLAEQRLRGEERSPGTDYVLHLASANRLGEFTAPDSVALCLTSPPYWDVLARPRSADGRPVRDYTGATDDLSRAESYEAFLDRLAGVFAGVRTVLRPGGYCVVNVMDLRRGSRFYPLHCDLAARLTSPALGAPFVFDDLIVWDRRADYNRLRPLGYPAVFRVNKVHEFLLIFRRPPAP